MNRLADAHWTRRRVLGGCLGLAALSAAGPAWSRQSFFDAHHIPYGVQLYPLSAEVTRDLRGSFRRLAQLGYQVLETAGLHGHSAIELKAAADEFNLKIISAHVSTQLRASDTEPLLTGDLGPIVDNLQSMGTRNVVMAMPVFEQRVVPKLDTETLANIVRIMSAFTVADWQRTADFLNQRGKVFHQAGISLFYHNHNFEFAPVGGTSGWDVLLRGTDPELVGFELDIGWAAAAGLDPLELLAKGAGRVRMVHVKDVDRRTVANFSGEQISAPLGEGKIDWLRLLKVARSQGVFGYFIEQEPPFVDGPFAAIAQSIDYLKRLG